LRRNDVRTDAYVRPLLLLAQERLFVRMNDIATSLRIATTPITDGYLAGDGLRCMVTSWRRSPDVSVPNRAKATGSYVGPALAKTEAIRAGCDEAIMLTVDGYVAESTTSNVVIRDADGRDVLAAAYRLGRPRSGPRRTAVLARIPVSPRSA
jgi:branched-chain amino acid aminotransferase